MMIEPIPAEWMRRSLGWYPLTNVLLFSQMEPTVSEVVEMVAVHLSEGRDVQARALRRVISGCG